MNDQQKSSYSSTKQDRFNNIEEDAIEAYFMKGKCLIELMNFSEALQCFQKVIEYSPSNHEVFSLFEFLKVFSIFYFN